ncbi:MAG: YchJ family metal-binding protein [Polyangiaceae bacterium]
MPCGSGATYSACCGPAHAGARESATAEALMRSRYSAFALGDAEYLIRRSRRSRRSVRGSAALVAALREVRTSRFMALTVKTAREDGDRATVSFHVRVFVGRRDRSFEETSAFVREDGAWRYQRALADDGSAPVAAR